MNEKTRANINRFGRVGKIILTVLLIAAILAAILGGAAAIAVATLPKDAVKVSVTEHATFTIQESTFPSVWSMLADGFAYTADQDPSALLQDEVSDFLPPENTELDTNLHFFHQSYSSAKIHSEGGEKVIEADSAPVEYRSSDLVTLFVFAALFAASAAVALWMLRKLFQVLSVCDSPFCMELVAKLRAFGFSLLPVAVFASLGETWAIRFLSAGQITGVSVQWGVLLTFVVTMCLVTVFRYGVQLQKESDETL